MINRLDPDVLTYRREVNRRRPRLEARRAKLLKEAQASYKEANKPYRPGRPRSIKVGKNAP